MIPDFSRAIKPGVSEVICLAAHDLSIVSIEPVFYLAGGQRKELLSPV